MSTLPNQYSFTPSEVARIFNRSQKTILVWIKKGFFGDSVFTGTRPFIIPRAAVERFISQGGTKRTLGIY